MYTASFWLMVSQPSGRILNKLDFYIINEYFTQPNSEEKIPV